MAYSNRRIPNDATLFPEPQLWLTWIAEIDYSKVGMSGKRRLVPTSEGKLRRYDTLAKAKESLMWIGRKTRSSHYEEYYENVGQGMFITDWAVYHWQNEQWEKIYEGFAGEARKDNPLFQRRFTKDEKVNPIDKKLVEQAIASILS